MRILGIIPARKGSKRIPGKNLLEINGVSLVERAILASTQATLLTKVVVSSDDERVSAICERYPTVEFIRRPDEISGDHAPALAYVSHVLSKCREGFDAIAIVQPTTPFVNAQDIDDTIRLMESSGADSSVSVVKIEQMHHPLKLKKFKGVFLEPFLEDEKGIVAAEKLPDIYSRNGAVYVTRIEIIKQGKILGEKCAGYVMPPERSVDINYPIDLEFARFLAKQN